MIQSWSFALAWALIVLGFTAVFIWVVHMERAERHRQDRWLSQRATDRRRWEAWMEEMTREV